MDISSNELLVYIAQNLKNMTEVVERFLCWLKAEIEMPCRSVVSITAGTISRTPRRRRSTFIPTRWWGQGGIDEAEFIPHRPHCPVGMNKWISYGVGILAFILRPLFYYFVKKYVRKLQRNCSQMHSIVSVGQGGLSRTFKTAWPASGGF